MKRLLRVVSLFVLCLCLSCGAAGSAFLAPERRQAEYHFKECDLGGVPAEMESAMALLQQQVPQGVLLYALPRYQIDFSAACYKPDTQGNCARWYAAVQDGADTRLFSLYGVKNGSAVEVTENLGMTFDSSLGVDLVSAARAAGQEPLFFVFIGQMWLVSRAQDGALFACGYSDEGGEAQTDQFLSLSESDFLRGLLRYKAEVKERRYDAIEWLPE